LMKKTMIKELLFQHRGTQYLFLLTAVLSTIFFGRAGFLLHVFFVTNALVGELVRISDLYGNLPIPHETERRVIILIGYLHTINPILMHVWPVLFYAHLPVCFAVHCCHMAYVCAAFRDMGYSDQGHICFLIILNLAEFMANVSVNLLGPQIYVICAIATEMLCPFLLTFKMKKSRVAPAPQLPTFMPVQRDVNARRNSTSTMIEEHGRLKKHEIHKKVQDNVNDAELEGQKEAPIAIVQKYKC